MWIYKPGLSLKPSKLRTLVKDQVRAFKFRSTITACQAAQKQGSNNISTTTDTPNKHATFVCSAESLCYQPWTLFDVRVDNSA